MNISFLVIAKTSDLFGSTKQFTEKMFLLDDFCIVVSIGRRRDDIDEFGEIRHTTCLFEVTFFFEA